ncbi:hypothetical protein CCR75_004617 [Bremia lactucae]|uniref:HTH CENPB-type domain-containing protein n=1 Tax=Bremia lactucae TaxID=4779 RepID=A0A976ILY2_BRELC|nr:hypothetical protein CCR75_004617 [Bremia lactucae]
MTDNVRVELCEKEQKEPKLTQKELSAWLEARFNVKVIQVNISNTLKRAADLFANADTGTRRAKLHRTVNYPVMESALFEWFQLNCLGQHERRALEVQGSRLLRSA